MTVPYDREIMHEVSVDADGDICMDIETYSDGVMSRYYSIEQMEHILDVARRHRDAYKAAKEADFDGETYTRVFDGE